MAKTLNKDGSLRKIGSGKTKGAGCYAQVTLAELKEVLSNEAKIQVSRVWLKNIGLLKKSVRNKLPPEATTKTSAGRTKSLPKPKITRVNNKKESSEQPEKTEIVEGYEPPPLFATGEIKLDQY